MGIMEQNNLTDEEKVALKSEFEKQTEQAQQAAATMCAMYMPKFELAILPLGNKALRRVLNALISYPLEETPKFVDQNEKNAFLIGNKLLESKYSLIIMSLLASQQVSNELQEVVEQAAKQEGEVKNG